MAKIKKLGRLRADVKNMKRINGMPLSRKAIYLANAVVGETLRRRTFGTLGLRLAEISLTDRCQCRCLHCFASTEELLPKQHEMSTSEVKRLLGDLSASGITEVCFSGGEPLLREDISELVQYARDDALLVVRLITNGILLDEEMVQQLKQAGLNWCSLSLDYPSGEKHDAFRGYQGCFDKVIGALKLLIQHNIPCSIVTVARKEAIHSGELEDIVNLGIELGVTAVRINFPVPIGRYKDKAENILSRAERDEVRKLLRYGIVTMESPREGTSCTAAVTKLNILPNGDVTPCVFVPISYGNIRNQSFVEIWKEMKAYTKEFKVNGQCPFCDESLRKKLYATADARKQQNSCKM